MPPPLQVVDLEGSIASMTPICSRARLDDQVSLISVSGRQAQHARILGTPATSMKYRSCCVFRSTNGPCTVPPDARGHRCTVRLAVVSPRRADANCPVFDPAPAPQVRALSEALEAEHRRNTNLQEQQRRTVLLEAGVGLELRRLTEENAHLVTRLSQMEQDLRCGVHCALGCRTAAQCDRRTIGFDACADHNGVWGRWSESCPRMTAF